MRIAVLGLILMTLIGCNREVRPADNDPQPTPVSMAEELLDAIADAPGTVGIAFVSADDTVLINNGVRFPMMSVFKLHQSLAVLDRLRLSGRTADSVLHIPAAEIDSTTWSPIFRERGYCDWSINVGELLRYALISSDNNASNILFDHIVDPAGTDRYIRSAAQDTTFRIAWSERQMKQNHDLAYDNYSSPLSAALLIRDLFAGESTIDPADRKFVCDALTTVTTGQDRLGKAIEGHDNILFGHKTGSGYRNGRGELAAHNDVGYFRLPDGRDYALAVMIRDFAGSEEEASDLMARISGIVLRRFEL